MQRIFPDYAYGPGPREGCWWDETIAAPSWPAFRGEQHADVVIIGGGFTGLSAALHLAKCGASVTVLEAGTPGWGASGRNGGFCCTGGSKLSGGTMRRLYGEEATAVYEAGEEEAVHLVRRLLDTYGIDADTHSDGETQMAHSARAMRRLRAAAAADPEAELIEQAQLADAGLNGPFHGALTTRTGFGLNPRKYLFGLAKAAQAAGAMLFQDSPATGISQHGGKHLVRTAQGKLRADTVVIATNGYSSEDIPAWLRARTMPAQSTVMVTRPLSDAELAAQGWTSDQMAYDTRNLLHYFRLMPDRRFLFGMRGGLMSSPRAEGTIRRQLRRDFDAMFPAWKAVEAPNMWSGMVCLSRNLVPFVGPVPQMKGLYAGLCYHGNGVAMGSYSGRLLADLVQGRKPDLPYSSVMQSMGRFPLGRFRRALMFPAYALLGLMD